MGAVNLQDVPKDGAIANFHHWLELYMSFFGEAGSKATRKIAAYMKIKI